MSDSEAGTLPTTMKYVNVTEPGSADKLSIETTDVPRCGDKDVLIKVVAAGVNRPDIIQRQGFYPPPKGASPILGLEVSGVIIATGSLVKNWEVGDKVCALANGGGYAEYVAVPAAQCLPIPSTVSMPEAAAIPETFFTVWANLFHGPNLIKGQSFLVHGGSSGIGTTAIQLAKAFGCEVYTTVGNESKRDLCRAIGADHVILYKEEDFVDLAYYLSGGRGIDVILDMVGGDYFEKNLQAAATGGKIISIAFLNGSKVDVNLMPIMLKRLQITGSTLRPQSPQFKAQIASALLDNVWPLFENYKLMVAIDSVYRINDVVKAHQRMESGQNMGKIILLF